MGDIEGFDYYGEAHVPTDGKGFYSAVYRWADATPDLDINLELMHQGRIDLLGILARASTQGKIPEIALLTFHAYAAVDKMTIFAAPALRPQDARVGDLVYLDSREEGRGYGCTWELLESSESMVKFCYQAHGTKEIMTVSKQEFPHEKSPVFLIRQS